MKVVKPLRVCMITGAYPPARCGIGDYTAQLCSALAESGEEVFVVTSSYLEIPCRENSNPRVLPIIKSWRMHQAPRALRTISRIAPDVVVFQIPHLEYRRHIFCNLLIPLVKIARPSAKVLVTFHEMLELREVCWKKSPYLARVLVSTVCADAIVLMASTYLDVFRTVLGRIWPKNKTIPIRVIPVASSIPSSKLIPKELDSVRNREGLPVQSLLLTYFGFVHPGKGFEDALTVTDILRQRGLPAHLFVIAQLDPSQSYHRELRNRITNSGLDAHITVTGFVSDRGRVADCLALSDVCLLPFRPGVHPKSTSFLAARAQGVFVLTTSTERTGYSAEENVYYTRPGDVESMVEAIKTHAGKRIQPGAMAKQPSWKEIAQRHQELYVDLISERGTQ